jgi:hypothetical protein
MKPNDEIRNLISELRSMDGAHRERARKMLVELGTQATKALLELLSDRDEHVRWEACKILGAIRDPIAAAPLAASLRDENIEVQWLATEALIALGPEALVPLLQNLELHFDSIFVRQGAFHVLHDIERDYGLNEKTLALMNALHAQDPVITVAWAAHEALESLRARVSRTLGVYQGPLTET